MLNGYKLADDIVNIDLRLRATHGLTDHRCHRALLAITSVGAHAYVTCIAISSL